MFLVYPAVFHKCNDSEGYFITFPDFEGASQADTESECVYMAQDFLGINLYNMLVENKEFPKPTSIQDVIIEDDGYTIVEDSFVSLVGIDIHKYAKEMEQEMVRKNVTIPSYLNEMGKNHNINFSKLLTEALEKEFEIE